MNRSSIRTGGEDLGLADRRPRSARPRPPRAAGAPTSRLLCVLACGGAPTPRAASASAIAAITRVDPVEVDDEGRRVELGRASLGHGDRVTAIGGSRSWEDTAGRAGGAGGARSGREGVGDTMTISPPTGLALESIAEVDPGPLGGDARRAPPPARQDRADRQRELRVGRGHGGPGLLADQQVRRGPAGQALLRRLRVRRRRRAARPGARARPLPGRRARQRPAALAAPRPTWPRTSASSSRATGSWA